MLAALTAGPLAGVAYSHEGHDDAPRVAAGTWQAKTSVEEKAREGTDTGAQGNGLDKLADRGADDGSAELSDADAEAAAAAQARATKLAEKARSSRAALEDALTAANKSASRARDAQVAAHDAARDAAAAQLNAVAADYQAARARDAIAAWVSSMAREDGASSAASVQVTMMQMFTDPEDTAATLRQAEAADRVAGTLGELLTDLADAVKSAHRERVAAEDSVEAAAAAHGRAEKLQRKAAEAVNAARALYVSDRAELVDLLGPAANVLEVQPSTEALCGDIDPRAVYLNGELSGDVLCPTPSAPWHKLRTDAARAYEALSARYAEHFGTALCLTDSYRTFSAQVDLKKRKPTLAAVPGTSNHGWGIAIDVCGGAESFGTPQHDWMMANAPLFGWYLPEWAQIGGSKPEPWHWEFSAELAEQMRQLYREHTPTRRGKNRGTGKVNGAGASVKTDLDTTLAKVGKLPKP